MTNPFFERPILHSPYEIPARHWELDATGQPTQQIAPSRRHAEFITPIPKPKKQKGSAKQESLLFDEGKGLSTQEQQYDHTAVINAVRQWWQQRIARQRAIDASIAAKAEFEFLYDKPYEDKKKVRVAGPFTVATHAEEFARGVDTSQIVSLLNRVPKRVDSTPAVLQAMADVSNEEVTLLMDAPYILYVEGESDERILRAWAGVCGAQGAIDKNCFKAMGRGGKKSMKARADQHFKALQQIVPSVVRLMLFDFDEADEAFRPESDNPVLVEWKRRNIENYLLVPDAWKRAALRQLQLSADDLFAQSTLKTIDDFFVDQNLTLPAERTWRQVAANVFSVVNGKGILFENSEELFHRLKGGDMPRSPIREQVALSMTADEIHEDVHEFIAKLRALTGTT